MKYKYEEFLYHHKQQKHNTYNIYQYDISLIHYNNNVMEFYTITIIQEVNLYELMWKGKRMLYTV